MKPQVKFPPGLVLLRLLSFEVSLTVTHPQLVRVLREPLVALLDAIQLLRSAPLQNRLQDFKRYSSHLGNGVDVVLQHTDALLVQRHHPGQIRRFGSRENHHFRVQPFPREAGVLLVGAERDFPSLWGQWRDVDGGQWSVVGLDGRQRDVGESGDRLHRLLPAFLGGRS